MEPNFSAFGWSASSCAKQTTTNGQKSVAALAVVSEKSDLADRPQEKLQKIFANFLDAILPELVGNPLLKADSLCHLQCMLDSQMTVGFHCQSASVL
jgi:hypothetical protein